MNEEFDIVIIGGGHSGLEAAWIASQFNLSVAIITMPEVPIASTPCNPAIGGVGKGQVVRELDALGGVMGQIADQSAIQCRILNESKGYAVQSTRFQVDKDLYSETAEKLVAANDSIETIRKLVKKIDRLDDGSFIIEAEDVTINSAKVVVTTGTFLNGTLHTGEQKTEGGRVECRRSPGMEDLFDSIETLAVRFKTGTPARLNKDSIDYSVMVEQRSDERTRNFHCLNPSRERFAEQVSCYLTRTNDRTLGIIRENKERSPIFNGQIKGVGPRYCPSIEDKAFRYLDRNSHHVFIEPEGLKANTIYPNGVSTSLPKEVQLEFLRTIEGLEKVEIEVYGYAVEYDVVKTSNLSRTLEYQTIPGLYFAGQVNGTSGYEEAAGQGYIAGVNAALAQLGRKPLILDRNESYIGVMIEDLVTNERDEPYRLFTARAENRLFIREDNTINRMFSYRASLGLNKAIDIYQNEFVEECELLTSLCLEKKYIANPKNQAYFKEKDYGSLKTNISLAELVKRSKLSAISVLMAELSAFDVLFKEEVVETVAISLVYDGYIQRAQNSNERIERIGKKNINWKKICDSPNLSNECKQRIEKIKPETFGQLQRMDGIRPATLAYVAGNLL